MAKSKTQREMFTYKEFYIKQKCSWLLKKFGWWYCTTCHELHSPRTKSVNMLIGYKCIIIKKEEI